MGPPMKDRSDDPSHTELYLAPVDDVVVVVECNSRRILMILMLKEHATLVWVIALKMLVRDTLL